MSTIPYEVLVDEHERLKAAIDELSGVIPAAWKHGNRSERAVYAFLDEFDSEPRAVRSE